VTKPLLSIIIPAHNEEARLPRSLETISAFLETQPYTAEIIVVENGSHDRTYEIAQQYTARIENLRVFQETARGKGLAVKRGMLQASGEYRFICDTDLSMPIEEVNRFIPPAQKDIDVIIASREAEGAVRYDEPAYRHFIGRVFNTLVRVLSLPGLQDTQCGFKCFRDEVAEKVFTLQTMPGMAFDVEALFIARRMGYKIEEVPIPWYFDPDSRVRLVQDSMKMALDLLAIRRNARQGLYDN
jgi:glycosyltransferase involved in cell wall biosynthesis